ncbi:MAG: pilus assembly protein PilZ [Treponema sp.]|jgi:hypothetical protein|nr:pilus assembly protein PilZ [Treponema sp.]
MGILTSQKITLYYERFKAIDVTFTKEIVQVTRLITNQVYLKCVGDFWPCVIYSSSFQGAKIVANIRSGILRKLEQANNMASLRFCFKSPDTGNPVTFFVTCRSVGYAPYAGSDDAAIFSLQFTQRPPDDLIEIMGRILDANVNSTKRREERILITADSTRRLNLLSKESAVFIQGVPRRCILRDLSFSGSKLVMIGVAKFLVDREGALRVDFDDPRESFLMRGKFLRSEAIEGRKDLVALAMLFDENLVPMGYKIRINDFLGQTRAAERGSEDKVVQVDRRPAPKPVAAAEPPAKPAGEAKPAAPEAKSEPPGAEASEDFNLDLG